MYLVEKIINKCEKSINDWRHGASGGRSMVIEQRDYDVCGKSEIIKEALELERLDLMGIKWLIRGSDIEKLTYRVENINKFYEILNNNLKRSRRPKQEIIWEHQKCITAELEQIQSRWIRLYYEEILRQLEKGKIPKILEHTELYLPCFKGIDELKEPMYKRIFSRKYLQNSKTFEKSAQEHVISKAKEYCDEIEPEMNDTEVLSQLFIEEYSQELALKGPLRISIQKDKTMVELDLAVYLYGTVLNSETLKKTRIQEIQPELKRVITIENKANFISAPYEKNTLYIFTHGYLSPREREFLRKLDLVLRNCEVEFYHSGDLDYGGVKIYEYMKTKIFTKLKPLMMDVKTYDQYHSFGELISPETIQKLQRTEIPELQPLIDRIVRDRLGIEQESFLI